MFIQCKINILKRLGKIGFELIWFNVYSEVLGHLSSKIRFVVRLFPTNDSLMQKHSNVEDNSDVAKPNLSSIPSVSVQLFWKQFCKEMAFPHTFNFFTPFHGSERQISAEVFI